jgi:hypothetical protein
VNYPIGRQVLKLRGNLTRVAYQTYNNLDHNAYDYGGDFDWDWGSRWDGAVGYNERLSLGTFADQRIVAGSERNLRTLSNFYGNANYALTTPDFKARMSINRFTLVNSQGPFRAGDIENWVYAVGLRKFSKGRDDFVGVNLSVTDGKFPNREFTPGGFIDNSFTEYRLSGDVDYTFSGLSRIEADWGYTSRQHRELPQRNFDGLTGRLTARYGLTRRTSFNASVFREIGAFDNVTTTYILTQGASAGVQHEITPKLSAQAQYIFRNRQFTGDPGFVIAQQPPRDEDIQLVSFGLVWQAERNIRVNANYSYSTRTANLPLFDFAVNTFSVSGQISF